jgi:hypothetical protein
MSKRLLNKLGMGPKDLQPLSISKIQTAKMGASFEITGELKQRIYLQLGGCHTRFRCRPVVVRGLTHYLNLSGQFLRQNEIDQIHSRDAIKINGHEVPLLTARGRPAVPRKEVSSAPAYFAKKTILAPNSITMCSLRVPEIIRGTMPPGNASVDGSKQFMQTSNCHPWLMGIVDVKAEGLIQAGVMNTLDQPVTIQSGQQYGQVTLTCDVNEAHSFQARLPTIHPRSYPTSTPTSLTNATLLALSVNSLSCNLPTCHQTAPQSRDRSRNNLGRHLTATREEPGRHLAAAGWTIAAARGSHRLIWSPERPLPVGHNLVTTRGQVRHKMCSRHPLWFFHAN